MHQRKIVLLSSSSGSFDEPTYWINQHLQYRPYLLVKLVLPLLEQPRQTIQGEPVTQTVSENKRYNANGSSTIALSIRATQQRTYEASFRDVLQEAQFADLLVVEESLFLAPFPTNQSTTSLQELLNQVDCPVLVLSPPLCRVEQLILFYDGSSQDFSLIQQFSQDFYHFSTSLPTTLLLLQTSPLPPLQEKLLIEYLKLHYYDLAVQKISEEYQHLLPVAIDYTKGTLVVSSRIRPLPNFVTKYLPDTSTFTLSFPN